MKYPVEAICRDLSEHLSKRRLNHVFHVADTALRMAGTFGCDPDDAYAAGLLHDRCKYMDDGTMIRECAEKGIPVSPEEEASPYLLHGKLAAWYALHLYGITDTDFLNALTYHTTGRPDMTDIEKIIYTADFIEPTRKNWNCMAKIRKASRYDLDETVYLVAKHTLEYLKQTGRRIHPLTEETYRYYLPGHVSRSVKRRKNGQSK